MTEMAEIPVTK